MSQSTGQSGNANAADSRTDPAMKALYHMSKTAGIGLGDYAAINVLAVVGAIVGAACFLLLIFGDSWVMLAIPVAALVICSIALLQISGSNGTQVGRAWAVLGIVLAVAFGGVNVGMRAKVANQQSKDRAALTQLVTKLGSSATTQSTLTSAYDLFHPRFKELVNQDTFARTLAIRTGLLANHPVSSYALGDNVLFETNPDTKVQQATALIVLISDMKDERGKPLTIEIPAVFRRDPGGDWQFYAIPEWFGEEQPRKTR